MRWLAFLSILTVALACDDGTIIEPRLDLDLVAQASYNPANPFVGSWWGIDEEDNSLHHVNISHENSSGNMQVNFRDDAASICGGGATRFHAVGRIVSENVLKIFDLVAICQGRGGAVIPFGSLVGYVYIPEDDALQYYYVPETTPVAYLGATLTREKPSEN
jgi:hypothetical protein